MPSSCRGVEIILDQGPVWKKKSQQQEFGEQDTHTLGWLSTLPVCGYIFFRGHHYIRWTWEMLVTCIKKPNRTLLNKILDQVKAEHPVGFQIYASVFKTGREKK